MEFALELARWTSVLSFFSYGLACLVSDHMVAEFERFGLPRLRKLTGALEVLGSLGLVGGYVSPLLGAVSAAGLAILMVFAIGARVRVGDPFPSQIPALVLLALNAFVAYGHLAGG